MSKNTTPFKDCLLYKKIKHFAKKSASQLIELYKNNINQILKLVNTLFKYKLIKRKALKLLNLYNKHK